MAKMVHSDPTNGINGGIKQISDQGREYTANNDGEFDVDSRDVDNMKRFGLVEKAGK